MSERTDLSQLEVQLFTEALNELPDHKDISDVVCAEAIEEIKDFALDTVRRAFDIGLLNKRQHHRIPLRDGRFEVLANFEIDSEDKPHNFRLTTNKISELKMSLFSIESRDFQLAMHSGAVALRQSVIRVKGAPNDLLDGSLPVIWKNMTGSMSRYVGLGYSLDPPVRLTGMSFLELSDQLATARGLNNTISQLNREITLEAEYDY
jgi:hypothetical protein